MELERKEEEKLRIIKEVKEAENKENNNNFNIKIIIYLCLIFNNIFKITLIKKEEEEFDQVKLNVEYNFNKQGIQNPYEIALNPEEFEKTEEEKKEKKKKKKKIKKIYFFNIEDKKTETEIKVKVLIKKRRKRINYKIRKFSAAISGVLENLNGFLKLGETF